MKIILNCVLKTAFLDFFSAKVIFKSAMLTLRFHLKFSFEMTKKDTFLGGARKQNASFYKICPSPPEKYRVLTDLENLEKKPIL